MAQAPSGNLLAFLSEYGYSDLAQAASASVKNPQEFAQIIDRMPAEMKGELNQTSFFELRNNFDLEGLAGKTDPVIETMGLVNDKSIGVGKLIEESQAAGAANAAAYETAKMKGDELAARAQQQINEFRAELNAEKTEFVKNQPTLPDPWADGVDTSTAQVEFDQALNMHKELTLGKEPIGETILDPWADGVDTGTGQTEFNQAINGHKELTASKESIDNSIPGSLAETGKSVGNRTIGSTVVGIGEIGLGAGLMVQGVHQIGNETEQTNWVGKVRNRALVGIGAGVASDGALRATTGQGWVERVAEQAGNAISHFRG